MKRILYVGLMMLLLGNCLPAVAQDKTPPQGKDSVTFFNIRQFDRLRYQKVDSVTELNIAVGHVFMEQGKTKFYCDSAVLNKQKKIVEAYGNVHINDNDSVNIYSQYLIYHTDTRIAEVNKTVRMTDGKGTLTTEQLQYDSKTRTGTYFNGGKIINGKTVITSTEATYYADLKDIYFKRDVKLRDPSYKLDSDSLLYNTESQLATFITKTNITDSSGGNIVTTEGNYDMKNRKATFGKRSVIRDGKGTTVTGDNIFTDDSTGTTIITGNAVYIDTVQKVSLLSNRMEANKKTGVLLATQHPLMILQQDKDSVYLTADTIFSARASDLHDSAYKDLPKD
ncbi:MAG TPA: LPS export ABC transporter periplasmic protein LptC, partial [Chitinophagaceae bacterium]|nr:LPS export ABC transporter periplasmic protein LptC [Chitinophagaceae bacterium]